MKANIDVTSREEADQLRLGLSDQRVRVLVRVVGILGQLSSDGERSRVLRYVAEYVAAHPCDCDQAGNADPAYHASDCRWRQSVRP